MRHKLSPNVGNWYQNQTFSEIFEVVATDDLDGCVEVQYFSGEIEEYDLDTWYEMDLKDIPAPDDWSGPFEMSKEDFSQEETIHPEDWSGPLTDIEPEDYY